MNLRSSTQFGATFSKYYASLGMKFLAWVLFQTVAFLMVTGSPSWAQKPTASAKVETRFKVYGNCGACEERIAEALDQKGIIAGTWDRMKQEVWVVYRPTKVSLEQIHRYIAGAGHDTDLLQADSVVYNALPNCCLYREKHSPH